jgi:hypothetical protein
MLVGMRRCGRRGWAEVIWGCLEQLIWGVARDGDIKTRVIRDECRS